MKAKAAIVVEIEVDEPGLGTGDIQGSVEEYFYTANKCICNMDMELKEFTSGEVISNE